MRYRFLSIVLLLLSYCLVVAQQPDTTTIYFIKAGKLYDSEKNAFVEKQDIIVKGQKIIKVGSNLKMPLNARLIDLQHATVTPGLIDAHTHVLTVQKSNDPLEADVLLNSDIERTLRAVRQCRSYLDAGFTTIRDLGNSGMYLDLNLKRAIEKEWVEGPDMIVSGPIISPEDGQFFNLSSQNRHVIGREYSVVRNPEQAREVVKEHISHGVDLIKVVMGDGRLVLTPEEIKAIVQTAHEFGVKVTAHATYDAVIARALDAGVDGIEHGYNIADSLLDRMAKTGIYLVPTIGTYDGYRELFDPEQKQPGEYLENMKQWAVANEAIVKKAMDKKVMVVNGSDMYIYSTKPVAVAAKNTIEAYYEACKKANDVLLTATRNAAIACGIERSTGMIKEGMNADIAAFEGDLENNFVKSIYNVRFVMKKGIVYLK